MTKQPSYEATTLADLWFGVRNAVFMRLATPHGSNEPARCLVSMKYRMSPRHVFFGRVQFADPRLWFEYWRLKHLGRNVRSKYLPHQGRRECLRRLRKSA